jgi:cytochrome b involved in lipid metabolism
MADENVSVEEIKKHATEQDCWIVVDDVVWDITEFIPSHPGGNESEWYFASASDPTRHFVFIEHAKEVIFPAVSGFHFKST